MNIAVITARGGSKRIPHKNIKPFCGKPILAYSIEAAIQSGVFDEVMISTEDDEIAEIAQSYGAAFPFRRSEKTAGDHAMTIDVMTEVVESYQKKGIHPEMVCCIYPTAPFVTAEKLQRAYGAFMESGAQALIPIVKFSFPPQRCFVVNDGYVSFKWKEYELARSQDLEPYYHDAGQFYMLHTDAMMEQHTMLPEKTIPMVCDEMEVQDIDNLEDWKIAEIKYRTMTGAEK